MTEGNQVLLFREEEEGETLLESTGEGGSRGTPSSGPRGRKAAALADSGFCNEGVTQADAQP